MRAAKEDLQVVLEAGPAIVRVTDWDAMRAQVASLPAGLDFTPVLKGLPGDLCSCPHWGYVIKGRMRATYADGREETLTAGDLWYLSPGHTLVVEEDAEFVDFSPPEEHQRVFDVIQRNMAAQAASA